MKESDVKLEHTRAVLEYKGVYYGIIVKNFSVQYRNNPYEDIIIEGIIVDQKNKRSELIGITDET